MATSPRRHRLIIGLSILLIALIWVVTAFISNLPIPSWYLAHAVVKVEPIDDEPAIKSAANRESEGKEYSVTATRIKETDTFEIIGRALSAEIAINAVEKGITEMTTSLEGAQVTVTEEIMAPEHSSGPSVPMAVVFSVIGAMILSIAGGGFVISGLRR